MVKVPNKVLRKPFLNLMQANTMNKLLTNFMCRCGLLTFLLLGPQVIVANVFDNPSLSLDNLGRGIESMHGYLRGFCLTGTPEFVPNPFFTSHVFFDKSAEDITSYSESHGGGGINLGIVGAKASMSAIERMAKKAKTLSFVYFLHQRYGDWILTQRRLSQIGASLPPQNEARHRKVCGDKVLIKARTGLEFYLGVTLEFESEDAYRFAKQKYKVSSIFGSKSKTNISEVFSGQGHTQVTVHTWQIGAGRSEALEKLGGSFDITCQRENIAVCEQKFLDIQQYLEETIIFGLGADKSLAKAPGDQVLFFEAASYGEAAITSIKPAENYEKTSESLDLMKNLESQILSLYDEIKDQNQNSPNFKSLETRLSKALKIYYACQSSDICPDAGGAL